MKILNINNEKIQNPNLDLGYLKEDKIFIQHHNAIPEVQQKVHYKTLKEYPNGGKDVEEIIDIPYQKAEEAWDEYEDIQRYIEYTKEELQKIKEDRNKPTQIDTIEAQTIYTAMETNTLLIEQQPMALSVNSKQDPRLILQSNIKKWYKQKLWNDNMLNKAVSKGIFTSEEITQIVKEG